MSTKPKQLSTIGIARPLRVAYLVDMDECSDQLLDCIFSESYGRWGSRRSLIVPAKPDGLDTRYADWLLHYDADVIYSFVALADSTVARIHEKYGPAYLTYHAPIGAQPGDDRYFRIELPLTSLRSLSVVPALLSRTWGFGGPVSDLRIIDKYFDKSESHFINENSGFLSESYQPTTGQNFPQLFTTVTLISQESLDSAYLGKDRRAQYVVGERKILEELGKPTQILTLATASDLFAPYLSTEYNDWFAGFTIVVGDSPNDRVLFWNQHHCQENPWISTIASLRLPVYRIHDQDFLAIVKEIVLRRGKPSSQGHPIVTLRSCSLPQAELEHLAERLRTGGFWGGVRTVHHDDHGACIPSFARMYSAEYRYSFTLPELRTQQTAEFREDRAYVPDAVPWHMREALPPAGLREGNWMVDLAIDRINDHCRFSNMRHTWILPRRLHLENAFKVDWQDDHTQRYGQRVTRVTVQGALALPKASEHPTSLAITIPDDIDAFRGGLCADWEWPPFTQDKESPRGIRRYAYAEPSDKGRYLLAILDHFDSLPDAFAVLMNGYWRQTLISLGAVPVEKNPGLREDLVKTLRKRLGGPGRDLVFRSEADLDRLAREAIRFGRIAGKPDNVVSYSKLYERWKTILDDDLAADPHLSSEDREYYSRPEILDRSIQHLCKCQTLFQGQEWLCRRCFNRNWITIDDMRATLQCQICKREETAPVSGDWHFRANNFVVDAYREQGVEAVIWALWRLWDSARQSFYFAPSMCLWETYPKSREDGPDIEVDSLAIVDGRLYMCEAKSSSGLNTRQVEQLCSAAMRIRPDVLLIACMDAVTPALRRAAEMMQARLGSEMTVEIFEFKIESLEGVSMLPS